MKLSINRNSYSHCGWISVQVYMKSRQKQSGRFNTKSSKDSLCILETIVCTFCIEFDVRWASLQYVVHRTTFSTMGMFCGLRPIYLMPRLHQRNKLRATWCLLRATSCAGVNAALGLRWTHITAVHSCYAASVVKTRPLAACSQAVSTERSVASPCQPTAITLQVVTVTASTSLRSLVY